jgi:hypothetical protein
LVIGRLIAACGLLVAGSCSGGSEETAPLVDCATSIDAVSEPPGDYTVLGDAVAMLTSETSDTALQTSQSGDADPTKRLFAKSGLLVRAGAQARLSSDDAWLDWGSNAIDRRLDVGPCEGDPGWFAFAGGYLVADPACVAVTVTVDGSDFPYTMGVGAPCPGQQPPPRPSDT